jgi:hypothetical protein
MKKNLVLFTLFVLPIVAYLFFASGVNHFVKLPTITKTIPDVNTFKSLETTPVTLSNKITILGFAGNNIATEKAKYFNLYEKIYKRYKGFNDFQVVIIAPLQQEKEIIALKEKISLLGDISGWKFIFASNDEITTFYSKLQLVQKLNPDFGSDFVYIVDKNQNIRGRKGKSAKGDTEYKEGYNATKLAELHNEMIDDVKIILAEYRLALKKNNANRKKHGL